MSALRLSTLALSFSVLIGIGCDNSADLTVEVCGDVRVPQDVDAFRLSVLGADRESVLREGARELLVCPEEVVRELPQDAVFETVEEDAWVIVEGLKDGVTISTYEVRLRNPDGESVDVQVGLTRECLGIRCPLGQTCIAGVCQVVEFESPASVCASSSNFVPPMEPITPPGVALCPGPGSEVQ